MVGVIRQLTFSDGTAITPPTGSTVVADQGTIPNFVDFTEVSTPGSPAAGALRLYAKTSAEGLYTQNSSGTETQVGSGSGEKNYLQAGANTAAGWVASGAGITVATDSTAAEVPRPNTTLTGLKITGASGSTAYARYRFILDDADANKKLKVQFDLKPISGYVSSDFRVDVYSNTANDYSTGNTRLPLSTDSSSISAIPNLTGTYRTTFDAPAVSAKYIEVRIGLNGTNTHALVISDCVVGPGTVTQGAAVSSPVAFTPVFTGFGTVTVNAAEYYRVGEVMTANIRVTLGTRTGVAAAVMPPSGLTPNSAALGSVNMRVGEWTWLTANGTTIKRGIIGLTSTGTTWFGFDDYTTATSPSSGQAGTAIAADSVVLLITFSIPISEWSGSGTVNVVQNDVEYAYNYSGTTTAGASDTTSFAYGPAGAALGSIDSVTVTGGSATKMRVRFLTPIGATNRVEIEISPDAGVTWCSAADADAVKIRQGAGSFGVGLAMVNATDVDVSFGNGGVLSTNATYASAGAAWTSTYRWRVKKSSGGQAVGFGIVNPGTSAGLVAAAGVPGNITGTPIAAGYVGEVVTASIAATTTGIGVSGNYFDVVSISLSPGIWMLNFLVDISVNGATVTGVTGGIGTHSGNDNTGLVLGSTFAGAGVPTTVTDSSVVIPGYVVQPTVTTPYYGKGNLNYSVATPKFSGRLTAIRIA